MSSHWKHLFLQILSCAQVPSKNRPHLPLRNSPRSQFRKRTCLGKLSFADTSSLKGNLTFVFSIKNQIMPSGSLCLKTLTRNFRPVSLIWKVKFLPLFMRVPLMIFLCCREEALLAQVNKIQLPIDPLIQEI